MGSYTCAILIPTYQRPAYLARQVHYLTSFFDMDRVKVMVLDGSQTGAAENRQICNGIPIEYRHYPDPDLPFWNRMLDGLASLDDVPTVIVADDDLLDPACFWRCVDLLNSQPEYAVAHGQYLGFKDKPGLPIAFYEVYAHARSCEQPDALNRLFTLLSNYSALVYAVHRKSGLQQAMEILRDTIDANDAYMYELLEGSVSAITGKIKKFDQLYMAREAGISTPFARVQLDQYILDPAFSDRYQRFKAAVQALCRAKGTATGVSDEHLAQGIDWAFNAYIASVITPLRMKSRFTVLQRAIAKERSAGTPVERSWLKRVLRHPGSLLKFEKRFQSPAQQQMRAFLEAYRHNDNRSQQPV